VPEPHRCLFANAGCRRSALAVEVPGERNRLQYAGIPASVSLPSNRPDGESERVSSVVGQRHGKPCLGRLCQRGIAKPLPSRRATKRHAFEGKPTVIPGNRFLSRGHVRLFMGVITGAHHRSGLDVFESKLQRLVFQRDELRRRVVARHGQMVF